MNFTFELPCKKYVAHYLKINFGDPVRMNRHSDIGKYFYALAADAPVEREDKYVPHDSVCTIIVTECMLIKHGSILTKTGIIWFNRFLEDLIKDKINLVLDTLIEVNEVKIKEAVDYVYEKFEMDESIFPMENLLKQYFRYRQTQNNIPSYYAKNSRLLSDKKNAANERYKKT